MKKRVFISLLLILTYTVSFAHSFVPHCTDNHPIESHSELEHNHAHHNHEGHESNEEGHSHVEHGDHFDEGFLDYLVCLFDGVHHHDHSCDVQLVPQYDVFDHSSEKSVIGDQVISTDLSIPHIENQSRIVSTTVQLGRKQIDLTSSSGRAPPCTYLS